MTSPDRKIARLEGQSALATLVARRALRRPVCGPALLPGKMTQRSGRIDRPMKFNTLLKHLPEP